MEDQDKRERNDREEIFSKAVRAGRRTYFLDVKVTRSGEKYLTITESKRRFNNDQGKFFYEKHKIFLYREDFEKFMKGLAGTINFIETGVIPEPDPEEHKPEEDHYSDVDFEDLGNKPSDDH